MPLRLSIVTPEREVWTEEADFVLARTAGGDIGILPSHAPYLGSLGFARLVVQTSEHQKYIAVHGGFIQVIDDKVTVLAPLAELAEEIDIDRARRDLEEAERAARDEETDERRVAVMRATARVRTAADAGLLDIG